MTNFVNPCCLITFLKALLGCSQQLHIDVIWAHFNEQHFSAGRRGRQSEMYFQCWHSNFTCWGLLTGLVARIDIYIHLHVHTCTCLCPPTPTTTQTHASTTISTHTQLHTDTHLVPSGFNCDWPVKRRPYSQEMVLSFFQVNEFAFSFTNLVLFVCVCVYEECVLKGVWENGDIKYSPAFLLHYAIMFL